MSKEWNIHYFAKTNRNEGSHYYLLCIHRHNVLIPNHSTSVPLSGISQISGGITHIKLPYVNQNNSLTNFQCRRKKKLSAGLIAPRVNSRPNAGHVICVVAVCQFLLGSGLFTCSRDYGSGGYKMSLRRERW